MELLNFSGASGQVAMSMGQILFALGASFVAALVNVWLYEYAFGRNQIGVGVHKMFLIGGPAITGIMIAIQFSLPLSLGLLGALSILRFRTPIKDPGETAYLLLLIAASISFAVMNFWLAGALYIFAFIAVIVQTHGTSRLPGGHRKHLVISIGDDNAVGSMTEVASAVGSQLRRFNLQSFSTMNGKTSFHFQVDARGAVDWGKMKAEVEKAVAPAPVQLFVG